MEPFAYQKRSKPSRPRVILAVIIGAGLAVWHFDLVPHFAPVSTGGLDADLTNPDLTEADFLAMLSDSPLGDQIVDTGSKDQQPVPTDAQFADDPLMAALASQSDPLEEAFPEFGQIGRSSSNQSNVANRQEPSSTVPSGVVQVSVSQTAAGTESAVTTASFSGSRRDAAKSADVTMPAVLTPEVAQELRRVDQWADQGEILEAHAALSRIYWKQPEMRPHIQERIERTAAEIYANPETHFAEPYEVQFGETLDSIAKQFHIPWQYLARLNGVTPKTLQAGRKLKVMTGPFGAVVDLDKFELTVHAHGWFVRRYRIGIGRDHGTPLGEFTVQNKLENPEWYNPSGGVVSADDPSNPLGEYWLGLGDHIGIHGTIDPQSIGQASSRGCIHMNDDDIAEVFNLLGVGSPVVIRR